MLGIEDKYVWLAYVSCLASVLLCVVYGLSMRNQESKEDTQTDVQWNSEEQKVEERFL